MSKKAVSSKDRLLPEGWIKTTIGECAPLQRGFDLPSNNLIDGDYPVVYSNGIVNYHNTYKVLGSGIITGRSGTLGKVHYVDNNFWPHNTTLWVTQFKNCLPKFIYYLFKQVKFERFGGGSGVPTLNRNDAHEYEIAIPSSIDEQQKIAQALTDADNYISALEKLIEKKKMIKEGLMVNLLTCKQRLKEFAYNEDGTAKDHKDSELGKIPEDWDIFSLKEVLEVGHGKPQFSIESDDGKNPILGTGGILGYTNYYLYDKPSVLIGRKGTIDKPRYMDQPFWTVDTLFYTIINTSFNPKFIFYKFHFINWKRRSEASGVPSLTSNIIYEQSLSAPSSEEQKLIAQKLTDADDEISMLESKLIKATSIKQGMMQKLLTGEIRFA